MYAALVKTITQVYKSRIIRAYITIRFRIINTRILETILNYFRADRELLVIGCGFGLFDLLMGLKWPTKRIHGVDLSAGRIAMARQAARDLGLDHNSFETMDVGDASLSFPACDEILMLDVLHHVPRSEHAALLTRCRDSLRPGGYLVIKDIHRRSAFKLFFTWLLDMLMTRFEPVSYRDEDELRGELLAIGFEPVLKIRLNDILPYPHIQYVCLKPERPTPGEIAV